MQHLNDEQRRCFRVAQMGHNILILGKVGSGKSHLLRYMIQQFSGSKEIAITASTGMSRLQFHKGDTLHHWSGYGDGHVDMNTIIGRINLNPAYNSVKENILRAEILIIDEIGLISAKMLDTVEQICRAVRDNHQIFGGLQVIAAGSFTQLPPVASGADPGNYSFESKHFMKILPHKIQLTTVFRQKQPDLVVAVNELCMGAPSEQTKKLMTSLSRPLPSNMNPVYIFGTNFDVSFFNIEKLHELPGEIYILKSVDEGERKFLKKCTAPHVLALKKNCKVIVIRNLENGLVNGLTGSVLDIGQDTVTIEIDMDPYLDHKMGGQTFQLHRYKFLMRDVQNNVCAIRTQFPLALGYALTVHKAQGRSIPHVVVDAYNFWRPGQLGVAIGRATCKEGLQVQNYNSFAASLQHPDSVTEFYQTQGLPLQGSKACCKSTILDTKLNLVEEILTETTNLDPELGDTLFRNRNRQAFPYNLEVFLEENKMPPITEYQKDRNTLLEEVIQSEEFKNFLAYLYNKVVYFIENYRIPPKGVKCNWCAMVAHIYKFLVSSQHIAQCLKAFKTQSLTSMQNSICTELFHALLAKYTEQPKDNYINNHDKLDPSTLPAELKSTVRYIAGAALNSVSQKLKTSVHNKMLAKFEDAKAGFRAVQILNTLRVPQPVILKESCEPETLVEIIRRQGSTQGLTHISDECFDFFCKLYVEMDHLQNDESIVRDPKNANSVAIAELVQNAQLLQSWLELFSSKTSPCDCQENSESDDEDTSIQQEVNDDLLQFEVEHLLVTDMFEMTVQYFCRAHVSDVLSKYKYKIGKKKEGRLRSTLGESKSKKQALGQQVPFPCGVCRKQCIDTDADPEADFSESSVGCDSCEKWYHFQCVGLTGQESCLKPGSKIPFYCDNCKELPLNQRKAQHTTKGKGRGKKSKPSEVPPVSAEQLTASRTRSGRVHKAPSKLNL